MGGRHGAVTGSWSGCRRLGPICGLLVGGAALLALSESRALAQEIPPPGLTVAYMADGPRNDANAASVYGLILRRGAHAVVHSGDTDYDERPDLFERRIDEHLGPQFPYFVSVGNHDDGSVWYDYASRFQARCDRIPEALCSDDYGINSVVYYNGLTIVLSGVGTMGSGHEPYLRETLARSDSLWKVCSWHKRWGAPDSMYEACREYGAFVINGHEHNYRRTKTLVDVPNETVSPDFPRPDILLAAPGSTVVAWNGLGGSAITSADSCCSGMYAAAYDDAHGALFITYNVDGDPAKARGEFVDVNDRVIDSFTLMTTAFAGATSTTTTLLPGSTTPGTTVTTTTVPAQVQVVRGELVADTYVQEKDATSNYGSDDVLKVDRSSAKQAFLKFFVAGVGGPVSDAILTMDVDSGSESGGRVHQIADCGWDEHTMTWENRPAIGAAALDEVGAVSSGDAVAFDVSRLVPPAGSGYVCFGLDSLSSDGVAYDSREGNTPPMLELVVEVAATTTTLQGGTTTTSTTTTTTTTTSTTTTSTTTTSSTTTTTTTTSTSSTTSTTTTGTVPSTTSTTAPPTCQELLDTCIAQCIVQLPPECPR